MDRLDGETDERHAAVGMGVLGAGGVESDVRAGFTQQMPCNTSSYDGIWKALL